MKNCKGCLRLKSEGEFHRAGKYLQSKCKDCLSKYKRSYNSAHKNRIRFVKARSNFMRRYGIRLDDIVEKTHYSLDTCEICGRRDVTLNLDHNGKTNKIRGMICTRCNLRLVVVLEREPQMIQKALDYLKKYE